jgi:parallel beta-helix repeat protein
VFGGHNFVGGSNAGEGNVVAGKVSLSGGSGNFIAGNSSGAGILVSGARHNAIQSNQISGSKTGGIRLDTGANFNWLRANRMLENGGFGTGNRRR